jgi:hypothetical protein
MLSSAVYGLCRGTFRMVETSTSHPQCRDVSWNVLKKAGSWYMPHGISYVSIRMWILLVGVRLYGRSGISGNLHSGAVFIGRVREFGNALRLNALTLFLALPLKPFRSSAHGIPETPLLPHNLRIKTIIHERLSTNDYPRTGIHSVGTFRGTSSKTRFVEHSAWRIQKNSLLKFRIYLSL